MEAVYGKSKAYKYLAKKYDANNRQSHITSSASTVSTCCSVDTRAKTIYPLIKKMVTGDTLPLSSLKGEGFDKLIMFVMLD